MNASMIASNFYQDISNIGNCDPYTPSYLTHHIHAQPAASTNNIAHCQSNAFPPSAPVAMGEASRQQVRQASHNCAEGSQSLLPLSNFSPYWNSNVLTCDPGVMHMDAAALPRVLSSPNSYNRCADYCGDDQKQASWSLNHLHALQVAAQSESRKQEAAIAEIIDRDSSDSNFFLAAAASDSYRSLHPSVYDGYRQRSCSPVSIETATTPSPVDAKKSPLGGLNVIAETVFRISAASLTTAKTAKQDRFDKTSLYKTELCTNWMLTGTCTYGNKCHFGHGIEDLKSRMRVENYKTQPCCDPARDGCRRCMYGRRCNYCHPGEAIRRSHPTPYYDKDYYHAMQKDFGKDVYPFGIYV